MTNAAFPGGSIITNFDGHGALIRDSQMNAVNDMMGDDPTGGKDAQRQK